MIPIFFGGILFLIVLLFCDALPYISWYKINYTFKDKYHHSTYAIIIEQLIIFYVISLYYKIPLAIYLDQFRYFSILNYNIDLMLVIIGACICAFITQIHEIIYFKRLNFPDRGYPIHPQILFAKPNKK
jgi:hypothetical protein